MDRGHGLEGLLVQDQLADRAGLAVVILVHAQHVQDDVQMQGQQARQGQAGGDASN